MSLGTRTSLIRRTSCFWKYKLKDNALLSNAVDSLPRQTIYFHWTVLCQSPAERDIVAYKQKKI